MGAPISTLAFFGPEPATRLPSVHRPRLCLVLVFLVFTGLSAFLPTPVHAQSSSIGGLDFFGSDEEVLIGSDTAFRFTTDFTLVAWIYRATTGVEHYIAFHDNGHTYSSSAYGFTVADDDKLRLQMQDGSSVDVDVRSKSTIPVNTWTHVAAVHTAGQTMLFINGVLEANEATRDPIYSGGGTIRGLTLGRYHDGADNTAATFYGILDEVAVFNSNNAALIPAYYNAGFGKCLSSLEPGLVAGWHLDESSGTSAADFSGNGHSGTLSGDPSWTGGKLCCSCTTTVQFEFAGWTFNEYDGTVEITVTMTGTPTGPVSVTCSTTTGGSATEGLDYLASPQVLNWLPTEAGTAKTFKITIIDDTIVESLETINLVLSNPVGATLGSPSTAVVEIVDNDVPCP